MRGVKGWIAVAGGVAWILIGLLTGFVVDRAEAPPSTTTPPEPLPTEPQPTGGSFAIEPEGLDIPEPGTASFASALAPAAPRPSILTGAGYEPPPEARLEAVPVVIPTDWTLLTTAGEFPGELVNPRARRATFAVPQDLAVTQVDGVRLDRYLVAVPYERDIEIPMGTGQIDDVVPGVDPTATFSDLGDEWMVEFVTSSGDQFRGGSLAVIGAPDVGGVEVGGFGSAGWRATYAKLQYPVIPNPLPALLSGLR
jgi:hypothetical protein